MINIAYWFKNPSKVLARAKYWIYEKQNPDKPWLCPGTIKFLDSALTTEMIGVEFGSGRSTHWLAKRMKRLISIEHFRPWYETVQKQIADTSLSDVDYRLIPLDHPENEPERQFYEPLPKYASWLQDVQDETYDFVLVDGHYRSTCIRSSLQKLKKGGMLVVDDVELWMKNGPPVPSEWLCVDTSTNGVKTTRIWKRTS